MVSSVHLFGIHKVRLNSYGVSTKNLLIEINQQVDFPILHIIFLNFL